MNYVRTLCWPKARKSNTHKYAWKNYKGVKQADAYILTQTVAELLDARAQEKGALLASQPCLMVSAKL